jgi:hypothetical protein
MPVNRHVIWGISEDDFGLVAVEQLLVGDIVARIAAQEAMLTEFPNVTGAVSWRLLG